MSKRIRVLLAVLVAVVAVAAAFHAMGRKEGWHIDEIATLGLANGSQNGYITAYDDSRYGRGAFLRDFLLGDSFTDLAANAREIARQLLSEGLSGFRVREKYLAYREGSLPVWKDGEALRSFLMADEGFSIRDVYVNQLLDTHPPLYYLFVRAAYALYGLAGGRAFTLWPAFFVNLLFLLGCVWMFLRVGRRLGSAAVGAGAALFFALSPAGRSLVTYMRMYMALCFFVLWSLDAHLELRAAGWRFSRSLGWRMAIATALGFCTHYYFLIWAAFEALAVVLCMARDGALRRLWGYVGRMAGAAGLSLLVWPFPAVHLLFSNRSQEAAASLGSSPWQALASGWRFLSGFLFGSWWWVPLCVAGAACAVWLLLRRREAPSSAGRAPASPLHLILWPALAYLAAVLVLSPYEELRYMTCAVPLLCLAAAWGAGKIALAAPARWREPAALALCLAIAAPGICLKQPQYTYAGARELTTAVAQASEGLPCVYVTSTGAAFYRELPLMAHSRQALVVTQEELPLLGEDPVLAEADAAVVYIHDSYSQTEIMREIRELTGFGEVEVLAASSPGMDARAYLLTRGDAAGQ